MKRLMTLLLIAMVAMLTTAGCNGGRKASAQSRWEETMDEARVEAARQSMAEGRYEYAQRVLEPCIRSDGRHQEDAEQLMTQIQMFAQLSTARNGGSLTN